MLVVLPHRLAIRWSDVLIGQIYSIYSTSYWLIFYDDIILVINKKVSQFYLIHA